MRYIRSLAYTGVLLAGAALLCAPGSLEAQRRRCNAREVSLAPPDGQVAVNGTTALFATAYDAAGNPCDNATYTWSSSNSSVASVDRGGIVHGVAVGQVTILARTGTGSAARVGRATVVVVEGEVTPQSSGGSITDSTPGFYRRSHPAGQGQAATERQPDGIGAADNLNVDPLVLVLIRGERRPLELRALRGDGTPAAPVPVVFQVGAGSDRVVSVDTFGFVSALGEAGTAQLTLSVPGQSRIPNKIVRVEVRNDSVQFSRRLLTMAPGMTDTLSVFVPAQTRALDPRLFQFSSSDPSKLTVTPAGVITAVATGTVTVTGQNAFLSEIRATVSIHRRVRSVTLAAVDRAMPADSTLIVPMHGTLGLRARSLGDDGTEVPEAPPQWRVQDPSNLVQFDTARGVVTGVRTGTAAIYAQTLIGRDTYASSRVQIRVVAGALATPRPRIGLGVGEHTTLDVFMMDEQRTNVGSANQFLTWSADSVARVESGNQLVALRPGHTRLVGHTPQGWDSTITVEVFVVGDLMVVGRHQGRQGVMMMAANGTIIGQGSDSLVEFVTWGPDLTHLAFTHQTSAITRTPSASLWLAHPDAANPTPVRLTDDSAYARYPVFVPGAAGVGAVVFEWNKGGRAEIWRVDVQDRDTPGQPYILTNSSAANQMPAVSLDGRLIAYVSVRETSPGRPAYALYTANIDGTGERLVHAAPQGHRILGAPTFTPDGRSLLFVRGEPQRLPTQRVFRIGVTAAPGDTAVAVTPLQIVVRSFSLSADGQTLALNTLEPLPNGNFNSHLVLFPVGGGAPTPIDTPDMRPSGPVFRPATPAAPAAPAAPR